MLVIDQGTVLDRIDHNVEEALDNFGKGQKELAKAEEKSKSARAKSCIACLLSFIAFFTIMLFLKHAH